MGATWGCSRTAAFGAGLARATHRGQAQALTPLGDDLQLAFTDVPYAGWAGWLAQTERQTGARARSVVARATATPGRADIEVTLRLAGR
jgi:type II secretory pathway component PulM